MTKNEEKNMDRCKSKKYGYCDLYSCTRMMDMDISMIDKCIIDIIESKEWNDEKITHMLKYAPKALLIYISKKRKDILPDVGTPVVTLRSGFSGGSGVIRYVSFADDNYIRLESPDGKISICKTEKWYEDIFAFDDNN